MNTSSAFDWLGDALAARTELTRTEARGLLRTVLRDVGLTPEAVNQGQLGVVVVRMLPAALARVRVPAPEALCARLGEELRAVRITAPQAEDAASVFGRLGRR